MILYESCKFGKCEPEGGSHLPPHAEQHDAVPREKRGARLLTAVEWGAAYVECLPMAA